MEFRKMLMITLYAEQKKKKDTDLQNSLLDSVGEGEGGIFQENSIETCILSRVKQITSSGWMHETSAWTWCTGKTQREWVKREVGGGIGTGNTCKPMAVSFQCMTKIHHKKKKNTRNFSSTFPPEGSGLIILLSNLQCKDNSFHNKPLHLLYHTKYILAFSNQH